MGHSKFNLNRRSVVKLGASGAAFLASGKVFAAGDAHFFIQVHMELGADSQYLFDARPLAMKQQKIIQNYTNEDAKPWVGTNGETAYTYSTMDPLLPVKDYFSVVHGIHTLVDSVVHQQNVNTLMANNAFGGNWFGPGMVASEPGNAGVPLSFIQMGTMFEVAFKNAGEGIILGQGLIGTANPFLNLSSARIAGTSTDASADFVRARLKGLSQGNGLFSTGVNGMLRGFDAVAPLEAALKQADAAGSAASAATDGTATSKFKRDVATTLNFFKGSVTRTALIVYEPVDPASGGISPFDAHAVSTAKAQPKIFKDFAQELKDLIDLLRATPFDAERSFFDVTTVMVDTDFSRTLVSDSDRNNGSIDIDNTGSDHNPLTNTILLAGKGIKGGLVLGGTDLASVAAYAAPSGAHLQKDPSKNRLMGQVYDFGTHKIVPSAMPVTYKAADYINTASVVNTVFKLFGVSTNDFRALPNAGIGEKAKLLDPLLS